MMIEGLRMPVADGHGLEDAIPSSCCEVHHAQMRCGDIDHAMGGPENVVRRGIP